MYAFFVPGIRTRSNINNGFNIGYPAALSILETTASEKIETYSAGKIKNVISR